MHTLIPNVAVLSKHLTTFAEACSASEVILFERTTFLVIATSTCKPDDMDAARYERTSELIKAFKFSCVRARQDFRSLELELNEFTAVLDEMTRNAYVLVVVHDPIVGECFCVLSIHLVIVEQKLRLSR